MSKHEFRMFSLLSSVQCDGVSIEELVEPRRPDNAHMESGLEFYSALADENSPAFALNMTGIRHVTAASAGG